MYFLLIFMWFKDEFAFRRRCGDYHLVQIRDIRHQIKGRIYLVPQFYITYLHRALADEWVWVLNHLWIANHSLLSWNVCSKKKRNFSLFQSQIGVVCFNLVKFLVTVPKRCSNNELKQRKIQMNTFSLEKIGNGIKTSLKKWASYLIVARNTLSNQDTSRQK